MNTATKTPRDLRRACSLAYPLQIRGRHFELIPNPQPRLAACLPSWNISPAPSDPPQPAYNTGCRVALLAVFIGQHHQLHHRRLYLDSIEEATPSTP